MSVELDLKMERAEVSMVRWMSDFSLRETQSSRKLRRIIGTKAIGDITRKSRLMRNGHVQCKGDVG